MTSQGKPTAAISVAQLQSVITASQFRLPSCTIAIAKTLADAHDCWLVENDQERIRGKCAWVLPAIFNNVFDKHNFPAIFNLFDNNNPYALASVNQNALYLVKARN